MNTQITVVVENTVSRSGLLAEHGLSVWIEHRSHRLLFDTGQGKVLADNASHLQIPLHQADAIILSHGHYDHTGGLTEALNQNLVGKIFAHPACIVPKYKRASTGLAIDIGMPKIARRAMSEHAESWVKTLRVEEVAGGLMTTGPIPRVTDFEDTGGPFFQDAGCVHPDPLEDDQALFFDTAKGIVVMLGCSHAGVINTLLHIRNHTGNRPFHCVVGGMHLLQASPKRLRRTIEELRNLEVQTFGPAHCTGSEAVASLWNAFPNQCFDYHVGTRLEFESR